MSAATSTARSPAGSASGSRSTCTGSPQLDAYSQSTHGAPFAALPAAQQDAVLTNLQANTVPGFTPDSRTFFNLVREHALQGMFCDPFHGGNANFVGWDLIGYPGVKIGEVLPAEQALDTTAVQQHRSTYSFSLFKKVKKDDARNAVREGSRHAH